MNTKKLSANLDQVLKSLDHNLSCKSKLRMFYECNVRRFIPHAIRDFYWKHIKTIWSPQHGRIRKAVPRHWMDLDTVLQNVNFEIIKSFYEDEYVAGTVDWEHTGGDAAQFATWLEWAYVYITSHRPALEKRIDAAYPHYKKVEKLEKEMEDQDTDVLMHLVKWRRHMWT